jgi:hypothetical protein
MDGFPNYGLLAGVGLLAGALNAVAGGGSLLTLPFLIVFGLPASVGKWHQSGGASSKPYRLLGISALGMERPHSRASVPLPAWRQRGRSRRSYPVPWIEFAREIGLNDKRRHGLF